jgi:hypothetical protein
MVRRVEGWVDALYDGGSSGGGEAGVANEENVALDTLHELEASQFMGDGADGHDEPQESVGLRCVVKCSRMESLDHSIPDMPRYSSLYKLYMSRTTASVERTP